MLESLKGVQETRTAKQEKLPGWFCELKDLEERLMSDKDANWVRHICEVVYKIPAVSPRLLMDYVAMIGPQSIGGRKELLRNLVSRMILKRIYREKDSLPVCLDAYGLPDTCSFNRTSIRKDTVFDNFHSHGPLLHDCILYLTVVVANSCGSDILYNPSVMPNGVVIIANSDSEYFSSTQAKGFEKATVIMANSNTAVIGFEKQPRYFFAVNCRNEYKQFSSKYDEFSSSITPDMPLEKQEHVRSLALQMEGKNGLEVYALGKQIVTILEGEKRA